MGKHSVSDRAGGEGVAMHETVDVDTPVPVAWVETALDVPIPDATVVTVSGEVDAATVQRVYEAFKDGMATLTPIVIVDLQGVSFCDSALLEVLCEARRQSGECGVVLRLVRADRGCVDRVLRLADLESHFALYSRLSEAIPGEASSGASARTG